MSPRYLLLVVLTVHVQHKQVVTQAADRDAWGEMGASPALPGPGEGSQPVPGMQQLFPAAQLRGCRGLRGEAPAQGCSEHAAAGSAVSPPVRYSKGQKLQQWPRQLLCRNGASPPRPGPETGKSLEEG